MSSPKRELGVALTVVCVNSISKLFLRTQAGGQGLRDDAMDCMRQHIPLRPHVNHREAPVAVEIVGFMPIAMEYIVPPVPNAIFIDHVPPPPPEDGVPVIRARDAINVDALSYGPLPIVLNEEFREFDLIDAD